MRFSSSTPHGQTAPHRIPRLALSRYHPGRAENATIRRAKIEHSYSQSEIGPAVDLRYSTICRIVNLWEGNHTHNQPPDLQA
jgi:hypothetical protein